MTYDIDASERAWMVLDAVTCQHKWRFAGSVHDKPTVLMLERGMPPTNLTIFRCHALCQSKRFVTRKQK